jgi:serine/threonine protein kinase
MAELFLLMQKDAERKPLFPGWYSVHSPTDGGKLGSAAKYDQLNVIQRVLGCPRPGQPQTKDNTWDGKEPVTTDAQELERWQKQFPDVPDDLLDVMHRCLQWDPKERITAEELLAHPAFTTVRNMRIETPALEKARATGLALVTESDAAKDDEGRRAALKKLVEQLEP